MKLVSQKASQDNVYSALCARPEPTEKLREAENPSERVRGDTTYLQ